MLAPGRVSKAGLSQLNESEERLFSNQCSLISDSEFTFDPILREGVANAAKMSLKLKRPSIAENSAQ